MGNVARILNSFPNAVVKIGGYTDSTGDAQLNYRLSDDRARATMLALVRRGVPLSRLQAKGYGPRYFVMTNKTPEGRSVNRRVSIRVVQK
ncbi:OmpA family protein [Hymenobacter humi]|uniref:OmpA family protein n=1 Tax=Hymenobacter humi TaxID=1411620 RepID=A0ABW2UB90_9BACT